MNDSNLPQENIELKAQELEAKSSNINPKNKPKYEVGIATPPPPRERGY